MRAQRSARKIVLKMDSVAGCAAVENAENVALDATLLCNSKMHAFK